jgi:hypothetical protein
LLAYDSKKDKWLADSKEWRLRDRDIEWMAVYGCKTINKNDFRNKGWSFYQNIFHRLHLFLGAYDYMWDGWTTEEVGRDFADNLIDGDTVKAAWMDGVSDWWVDNHPAVISAEKKSTLKNGKPDWPNTTMQKDKYHGRGGAQSDIDRSKLHWLGLMWEEG